MPSGTARRKRKKVAPTVVAREVCFAIMPFGGWLDDYYETIYCPAIEAAGLEPHRADDLYRPSTIVHDIWAYTKKAKLLVADLSGKNPNVFYELGLAHALGKPAILVAESMEDIPFDLRALRIIIYDKNAPDWGSLLRTKIEASIGEVLKSPVSAVLPAFLEVKETTSRPTVSSHERDLIEIKQELDLLRREIRTREMMPSDERAIDIGPSEAIQRIENYLRLGMPERIIVNRLSSLGPPPSWIKNQIRQVRKRTNARRVRKPAVKKAAIGDQDE